MDLMEGEEQQAQVAVKTPRMGGAQDTSWPQAAQTIRSFLIKKSALSSGEHLQARRVKVPWDTLGKSAVDDGRTAWAGRCWVANLCDIKTNLPPKCV